MSFNLPNPRRGVHEVMTTKPIKGVGHLVLVKRYARLRELVASLRSKNQALRIQLEAKNDRLRRCCCGGCDKRRLR